MANNNITFSNLEDQIRFQPIIVYPFDTLTPTAGFSVTRQLTVSYTGSAIRVRRSSDNAEQDIGFVQDGVDSVLDTVSLATFCSGANGFVTTVYDQFGSADISQSTSSKQTKIYDSSTGILLDNGRPYAEFLEPSDMALNATVSWSITAQSNFVVASVNSASDNFARITSQGDIGANDFESTSAYLPFVRNNSNQIGSYTDRFKALNTITYGQKYLFSSIHDGYLISNAINDGTPQTSSHTLNADFEEFTIGATTASTSPVDSLDGKFQECVVFNSDQTANKQEILQAINTYYSIY